MNIRQTIIKNLCETLQFKFSAAKHTVVFLRHGESQWNKENRFTGWTDVGLSPKGVEEARNAGKTLQQNGFQFDVVYTSVLTRAIQTYNYATDEMGTHYLPVIKHWRLNEKHYGSLQGLNKAETAQKHGEDQVKIWRRSYDISSPALEESDKRCSFNDIRYSSVPRSMIPLTESLKDCVARVVPFWADVICKDILEGKRVLVVAHGNSLRSVVKYIDNISEQDILGLNIPTSIPLVYEFDKYLNPLKNYYLADPEDLKKKMEAVANQGKAK